MLAADYAKFRLDPEPPAPTEEDLTKFDDPVDELFTRLSRMEPPLKLLEGLIIPKSMKGSREAWVFILVIGRSSGSPSLAGGGAAGIGGGVAAGAASAVLLRIWLVKLSKTQLERLYLPLMHALADADDLTAYCRGLVDARLKEARKRSSAPPRGRPEAGRGQLPQGHLAPPRRSATSGSARSTRSMPRGWSRSRRPSSASCATPSTRTTAAWPSSKSRSETELPQARREVPSAQGAGPDPTRDRPGRRWPTRWRDGMRHAAAELDAVNREVDALLPRLERPGLAIAVAARESFRP